MRIILSLTFCSLFLGLAEAQPAGYYDGTDGLADQELKAKLHSIITGHEVFSYDNIKQVLPDLFEDPENPQNIILFYKGSSIPKANFASNNEPDFWNREHTWPKSHGFPNDADTAFTDVHNLTPSDATVNTSKSNKDFNDVEHTEENEEGEAPDTYTTADYWEPRDEIKGDVARILFYMDTRYESAMLNLQIVDRKSFSGDPEIGVLYTLLRWHEADPVDDVERARHEKAYGYQLNRNPFIDHPEWVASIWGDVNAPNLTVNQLNFSTDFGTVPFGHSLVQQYQLKGYNLESSLIIIVEEPFSLSADGDTYAQQLTIANDPTLDEQVFTVYLKFEPQEADEATSVRVVTHSTSGANDVSFEVQGKEGEVSVLTIAEARQQPLGAVVQVAGVVIDAGNNNSSSRVIFDGTAGIVVRSFDAGNESALLVQGDSILVNGGLSEYGGVLQIEESPIRISLIAQGANLPEPQEVTVAQIGEEYESELVVVRNVTFDEAGGTFAGGGSSGNFSITDPTGSMVFRIGASSHPLVGQAIPTGVYDITGFVGEFGGAYQISPRTSDDLLLIEEVEEEVLSAHGVDGIRIFPNPTTDRLMIISANAEPMATRLVSLDGRLIFGTSPIGIHGLDMQGVAPGIYLLQVTAASKTIQLRVVKK